MEIRKPQQVEVLAGYICDICNKKCCKDAEEQFDSTEHATLRAEWGFWSDGKDMSWHECHGMKKHRFMLTVSGVSQITPKLADALYEATAGDIEFEMRDGLAVLDFERNAASLRDAVLSAIRDVEESGAGVRVVRVESDDANTVTKINADLLQPAR